MIQYKSLRTYKRNNNQNNIIVKKKRWKMKKWKKGEGKRERKRRKIDGKLTFEWCDDVTEKIVREYDDGEISYVLEVDLHYPKELHDLHNDYPLAPIQYKPDGSKCHKLCLTFEDKKDYIVHIKNLKFYLEQGLVLTKMGRAFKFQLREWLKDWIDINTESRTKAKHDFEKDYFKLMNNAVFGKTMENVRDRVEIKCAFDGEYNKKYNSKSNYHSSKDGYR